MTLFVGKWRMAVFALLGIAQVDCLKLAMTEKARVLPAAEVESIIESQPDEGSLDGAATDSEQLGMIGKGLRVV